MVMGILLKNKVRNKFKLKMKTYNSLCCKGKKLKKPN